VLAVHGGAGRYAPDDEALVLSSCLAALDEGYRLLEAGAPAVDVVETAIRALEDNPIFNAGTGSVLNLHGDIEMDASIMEGSTLRAGAVAGIRGVRNPISVARRVMEDGRHVLLTGSGAKQFALAVGIDNYPQQLLVTTRQLRRWEDHYGTVGAVALDRSGATAAGTSTGGIFAKLPGRVGDSALIGSGTYANESAAVSCTGMGEAIIRTAMAYTAAHAALDFTHPDHIAETTVANMNRRLGAQGGLIMLDARGRVGYAHTTPDMPVAYVRAGMGPLALMRAGPG